MTTDENMSSTSLETPLEEQKEYNTYFVPLLKEGPLMEYFCELIDQDDKLIDNENLYCIKCLEKHITQAYPNGSDYEPLLEHLVKEHQMELMPPTVLKESFPEPSVNEIAKSPKMDYLNGKRSVLSNYFTTGEKGLLSCDLCSQDGLNSTFSQGSAHMLLYRHLKGTHNIVIPTPKAKQEDEDPTTRRNISSVWKYFCKITQEGQILEDGLVYCGECLKQQIRKSYNKKTSTGTLSMHLQVHHGIVTDDTWNGSSTNRRRIFFKKFRHDPNHLYCKLCMKQDITHRYKISTATSTLKVHLMARHNVDPDSEDLNNFSLSSDNEEDDETHLGATVEASELPQETQQQEPQVQEMPNTNELIEDHLNQAYSLCMLCMDSGEEVKFYGEDNEQQLNEHLQNNHGINTDMEVEALEEATEEISIDLTQNEADLSVRHEDQVNLTSLCRTCGEYVEPSEGFTFASKEDISGTLTSLSEMYLEVVGRTPRYNSQLSKHICLSCKINLINAYVYRIQALKTETEMIKKLEELRVQRQKAVPVPRDPLSIDEPQIAEEPTPTPLLAVPVANLPPPKKKRKIIKPEKEELEYTDQPTVELHQCKHCSKKYLDKLELDEHEEKRHKFPCEECNMAFATILQLNSHRYTHTSTVRPYICTQCEKRFASAEVLRTHLKFVHNAFGDTTQYCKICDRTFASKGGFQRHNKIHEGIYHECDRCFNKFTSISGLKQHIKTVHEQVRDYQCDQCQQTFKTSSHLTKHKESEHLGLKFYCKLCDKTISGRWNFNAHVKSVHPNKAGIPKVGKTAKNLET